MIMFPFVTILMVVACIGVYWIMLRVPGLIPIFGGSLIVYVLTFGANLTFNRLEMKAEEQVKENEKSSTTDLDEYEKEIIEENVNNDLESNK